MWIKWLPWRLLVKYAAQSGGFLDPIALFSKMSRFAQPSEVGVPIELLRAGALFHARGLINSRAIQQNLDWIWPYWVNRQFDPVDTSFIPRAFSITHVNLTHRNWVAVGIPDCTELPIVDPRGLVTPFFDSWSVDSWILGDDGGNLIPAHLNSVTQYQDIEHDSLKVITKSDVNGMQLHSEVEVIIAEGDPLLRISITGSSTKEGWLAIALRPFNPEGISFIHTISGLENRNGWNVDTDQDVYLHSAPDRYVFSRYKDGDVFQRIPNEIGDNHITCNIGMASAAALYKLSTGADCNVEVHVPLSDNKSLDKTYPANKSLTDIWKTTLKDSTQLDIPNEKVKCLYDNALRTILLHSPDTEVFAGPYTYKRFWFRDAAFILSAILNTGLIDKAEHVINNFPAYQKSSGYFVSQEGEWDSNGQVLWIIKRYLDMSGKKCNENWLSMIENAAEWICRKRLTKIRDVPHAGLMPSGFSAEHLGPNDYYYWDNFWSVKGLKDAASIFERAGNSVLAKRYNYEADRFLQDIEQSIEHAAKLINSQAIPASPYRRLDSGAVGSLVAGYPLQLWDGNDTRIRETADFLFNTCLINGAFFHDIVHSGINAYLTLHIAQIYLRDGNKRYYSLLKAIASLASPTGQWPEAIHPQTGGGCMGDGQHVWAAAEWINLIRNCFVYEETEKRKLILCAGIPYEWLKEGKRLFFGPAPTKYGTISLHIETEKDSVRVSWDAKWHDNVPAIEVKIPGIVSREPDPEETSVILHL